MGSPKPTALQGQVIRLMAELKYKFAYKIAIPPDSADKTLLVFMDESYTIMQDANDDVMVINDGAAILVADMYSAIGYCISDALRKAHTPKLIMLDGKDA